MEVRKSESSCYLLCGRLGPDSKYVLFVCVCVGGGGVTSYFLQFFNNYTGMILLIRVERMPTF